MTAFNVVRFRVKPGREQEFLDAHRNVQADWSGLKKVNMIKTGDRSFCIIAEWADMEDLAGARPTMIATLNSFRDSNCSACGYVESAKVVPARVRRIASRAPIERRRAVSMTERMSA
jgi:hypothetical protein